MSPHELNSLRNGSKVNFKAEVKEAQPLSDSLENESTRLGWFRLAIRRFSISKKIGSGHFLSLGIAATGIIAGFTVGDYYQQHARKLREDTQEEIRLLNRLENQILQARIQQQQFISSIDRPELFNQEHNKLLQNDASIKQVWSELKFFSGGKRVAKGTNVNAIQNFFQAHEGELLTYLQQVEELLRQSNQLYSQHQIEASKQLVSNFNSNPTAVKVDSILNDLDALVESAYSENKNAETALTAADNLRVQIIAFSIGLSVITAILLAILTTRAITQPLKGLTAVAHQVLQEANLTLQAPVTTEDEIGLLASSFNQLTQWASHYVQKLEQSRQVLEQRVSERTEEILYKNQQLLQAHDQLNQTLQNLQQSQSQLIQTEKMSSLGQMVAGVAHEINNPISFIYGNLNYLEEYVRDLINLVHLYQQQYPSPTKLIQSKTETIDFEFLADDLPKILASMRLGAERICQMVLSLRNFSRLDESEVKNVDLREGIDSTLLILNNRLRDKVTVVKQYGDLHLIECYPAQLNQVFMNILSNAIDALLAQTELSKKQIAITTDTIAPNQVRVRIRDNGPGIPSEIKHKIFDPFFTTKPVGQGTGLGLSICYQIVEKHQGQIEVISQPDQGTEFIITLPVKLY